MMSKNLNITWVSIKLFEVLDIQPEYYMFHRAVFHTKVYELMYVQWAYERIADKAWINHLTHSQLIMAQSHSDPETAWLMLTPMYTDNTGMS